MHAVALQSTALLAEPIAPSPPPPDLAVLARVNHGERVEVVSVAADCTQELFDRTVQLLETQERQVEPAAREPRAFHYMPEHADLRQRFIFAEAIGSYSALHDLLNGYSPAFQLFATYEHRSRLIRLSGEEARVLESYRDQVHSALIHANQYLYDNLSSGFSAEELHELNVILLEARERFDCVTTILGIHLINEVEAAVQRLYELEVKMRSVQPTLDGIFLVNSEVMFLPAAELIEIVNLIFNAVGNPYVAKHINGMVLLAGRNLLIQVVSFYSYYGKQQIYNVFKRNAVTLNQAAITHHIRGEIRSLFKACKSENRLVLKRVMAHAEREFELSVESIREEAETIAVAAVDQLLPKAPPVEPTRRLGFLARLRAWLFR